MGIHNYSYYVDIAGPAQSTTIATTSISTTDSTTTSRQHDERPLYPSPYGICHLDLGHLDWNHFGAIGWTGQGYVEAKVHGKGNQMFYSTKTQSPNECMEEINGNWCATSVKSDNKYK